jgi:hypothetical protein
MIPAPPAGLAGKRGRPGAASTELIAVISLDIPSIDDGEKIALVVHVRRNCSSARITNCWLATHDLPVSVLFSQRMLFPYTGDLAVAPYLEFYPLVD